MKATYARVAIACWAALCAASTAVHAQTAPSAVPVLTLADAYRAALEQDATLRAARAKAEAGRERLPQARAGLLPSASVSASRNYNSLESTAPNPFTGAPTTSHVDYYSGNQTLSIRQPIFRPYQMADLKQARSQVADANAQLERETQNLSVRVAGAYLDALLSQDQLELVLAQKKNYTAQLDAAERRFKAGAGVRTDIDDARAKLDMVIAQELEARQQVDYNRRALQVMVNVPVKAIAPLDPARMDFRRDPGVLDDWTDRALRSSPEILSLEAQRDSARAEIDKARAGHLPTLDGVAQWSKQNSDSVTTIHQRYNDKTIGVQLTVPLFSGGYVNSQVRQALASLEQVEQGLEADRRDLALRVEKEYRNITEGASKIAALEQAVRSSEIMVVSNRRSYEGGARTLLDILTAEEQRFTALRDLAQARYVYLLSQIRLKALAGEAGIDVIEDVNRSFKP